MRGQQAGWSAEPKKIVAHRRSVSGKRLTMSGIGWTITGVIYLVLICTLCILSSRKGHWVLGLVGFIFPILWLVGAILPARRLR
jgi:hypothetical protein